MWGKSSYNQSMFIKGQHRTIVQDDPVTMASILLDKHLVCLEKVSIDAERITQTEYRGTKWLTVIDCFFEW